MCEGITILGRDTGCSVRGKGVLIVCTGVTKGLRVGIVLIGSGRGSSAFGGVGNAGRDSVSCCGCGGVGAGGSVTLGGRTG